MWFHFTIDIFEWCNIIKALKTKQVFLMLCRSNKSTWKSNNNMILIEMSILNWTSRAFSKKWHLIFTTHCKSHDRRKTTQDQQKPLSRVKRDSFCLETEIFSMSTYILCRTWCIYVRKYFCGLMTCMFKMFW